MAAHTHTHTHTHTHRPYAKDSGQVGISVGDISFKMSVNVSANQSDGSLVLNAGACSFSIGSLSVVFHGGARF